MSRQLATVASFFVIASFLDAATTFYALSEFGSHVEFNPVMKTAWDIHPFFFLIVKGVGTAIICMMFFYYWHEKAFRIGAWCLSSVMFLVGVSNLTQIIMLT